MGKKSVVHGGVDLVSGYKKLGGAFEVPIPLRCQYPMMPDMKHRFGTKESHHAE